MGSSANVIRLLDEVCSGKSTCEYRHPNEDLYATQPCPKGVSSYLEVGYDCIKGKPYTLYENNVNYILLDDNCLIVTIVIKVI